MEVASERFLALTFDRIAVTSFFTVHSARPNSLAMSAFDRPRQIDERRQSRFSDTAVEFVADALFNGFAQEICFK